MSKGQSGDRSVTLSQCKDPGFTPGRRDVAALLRLWQKQRSAQLRDEANLVAKAMARGDAGVARQLRYGWDDASGEQRALSLKVISRISQKSGPDELVPLLAEALNDADPKVVREAARAVAKLDGVDTSSYEPALLAVSERAALPEQRAAVDALGRVGGASSLRYLRALKCEDADLDRRVQQAVVLLKRRVERAVLSRIVDTAELPEAETVWLRGRHGTAKVIEQQLQARVPQVRNADDLVVEHTGTNGVCLPWSTSLAPLYGVRSAAEVGLVFPLPASNNGGAEGDETDLVERIVGGLTQSRVVAALQTWTEGPPRFRLAFASGGRRRAVLREVARRLSEAKSALHNDTREYTWTVEIDEANARLCCFPRGADTRFDYRKADVPAATHPTLAALLAWAGRPRKGEVVWDPFCGSGTELIECAMLTPGLHLRGSDIEASAIKAARANFRDAPIEPETVDLRKQDALSARPHHRKTPVSLILSNPPMGRRVTVDGDGMRQLLHDFVAHAARVLGPGGRVVWLSPAARTTALAADRAGLTSEDLDPIDMGGFFSTPQVLRKPG